MKTILLPLMMPWFHWFEFGVISKQLGTWNFWERKSIFYLEIRLDDSLPFELTSLFIEQFIEILSLILASLIVIVSLLHGNRKALERGLPEALKEPRKQLKIFEMCWNFEMCWIFGYWIFFYLLFGCPTANFGALLRGQLYALNFNRCVLSNFDPKVTMSLVTRQGL